MKRLIVVTLAFLVGCSGAGNTRSSFLPESPAVAPGAATSASASRLVSPIALAKRGKTKVNLTLRIPRRHRGDRAESRHPATLSPLTQSVSIQIDGGAVHVFNSTPSSAGCHIGASGTVCTFAVNAPVGSDTFVVSTYSATSAGGSMLDRGVAVIGVAAGRANALSITLGPVASTTADTGPGSLRFAVGSANAGDTILTELPAGSTITLASPITITNRVSIAGPGVSASARRSGDRHASTTYSGVTISGGGTVQIFVLQSGATVSISGLILTQGIATVTDQPGGAIYNGGSLSLVSDVLTANTTNVKSPYVRRHALHVHPAPRHKVPHKVRPQNLHPHCPGTETYGGAVYNHGSMDVTGTIFDGNTAPDVGCDEGYGGAIYNDEYGILNSSGNLYTNNSAYYGGAVYNNAYYGQATFTSDTFSANLGCTTVTGCASSGCTSPSSDCSTYAYGEGAAIYDEEGPGVVVTGSVFENNAVGDSPSGDGYGGALYLEAGTPSVTGTTFTGNLAGGSTSNCAEGYGGAIYLDSDGPLNISNDTFTGNKAGGDYYGEGGAIYAYEPIQGSNDTFSSNLSLGTGSPCGTDGEAYGGAIYGDSTSASINLSNSTFSGNSASSVYYSYAGAIYNDGYSRLNSDTFTSNSAIANSLTDEYTYAYGGAIYNDDESLTISGSTFTSNTAQALGQYDDEAYGGAIYSGEPLSSTNDTFASNTAIASGSYLYPDVYGGAIYSDDTFTSNGDAFKSNSASGPYYNYGGAVEAESTTAMSNDTFTSNSLTGGYYSYGGALDLDGSGTSSVSNSTFTSNVNSGLLTYGGAITAEMSGVALNGLTVSNNVSTTNGGGIYVDDPVAISNSTISGNSVPGAPAYGGGGGIYGDDTITLVNSTVSGNSTTVSGIYAGGGGIYNDSGLSMTGSTISGNSVLGSYGGSGGGGIFNYDDATISNSTLTGNSSSIDGGGFETYGTYTIDLFNDTLFGNSATGSGGNIDNPYAITLANSIVAGGSATTGPDIDNTGTLTSGDYNIIQTAVAGTALAGTTTHNQTANPLLLALSNNSGPTFTNADQASSPGQADIPFTINNGSVTATCGTYNSTVGLINVDQRGFTRGAGGRCDVGAYEFSGSISAIRVRAPVVRGHHHPKRMHPRSHPGVPPTHASRPAQR